MELSIDSTVTLDGCEQKLGKNLCHDSQSIATKVCSQNSYKLNGVSERDVRKPCRDLK